MRTSPNITIVSPFRNAAPQLDAYAERADCLRYDAHALRWVFVEGDSEDDTYSRLKAFCDADARVTLVKCDTGAPHYPSIVHPERFRTLATVFNAGLDVVDLDWSQYVLMLPCDVIYGPDLLSRLVAWDLDIVAPFFWKDGVFYDIWGFTINGHNLLPFAKSMIDQFPKRPFPMDTIGGVQLTRANVLKAGVRYSLDDVDRGYCTQARSLGFGVWADPTTHVEHS